MKSSYIEYILRLLEADIQFLEKQHDDIIDMRRGLDKDSLKYIELTWKLEALSEKIIHAFRVNNAFLDFVLEAHED